MNPEHATRQRNLGGTVFSVIVIALMAHLTFAALQGEYGLFRLFQVQAQEKRLQTDLVALRSERAALANKTRRISAAHLDFDLLDEQARRVLGLGRADEIIIR